MDEDHKIDRPGLFGLLIACAWLASLASISMFSRWGMNRTWGNGQSAFPEIFSTPHWVGEMMIVAACPVVAIVVLILACFLGRMTIMRAVLMTPPAFVSLVELVSLML